jgi:hypothetical protein
MPGGPPQTSGLIVIRSIAPTDRPSTIAWFVQQLDGRIPRWPDDAHTMSEVLLCRFSSGGRIGAILGRRQREVRIR